MAEFLCVFCGAFYVNSCYLDYRLSLSARSSFRVKTELRNVVFFLLKVVLDDVGYRVTVMVLGMDTVDLTDVAHVRFRPVVHEQGKSLGVYAGSEFLVFKCEDMSLRKACNGNGQRMS